jgi:hypothetical protein
VSFFFGSGFVRGVEQLNCDMPVAYRADSAHVVGHFYFCRRQRCSLTNPSLHHPITTHRGVSFFWAPARGESNHSDVTARWAVTRGGLTARNFYFRPMGTKMQLYSPRLHLAATALLHNETSSVSSILSI